MENRFRLYLDYIDKLILHSRRGQRKHCSSENKFVLVNKQRFRQNAPMDTDAGRRVFWLWAWLYLVAYSKHVSQTLYPASLFCNDRFSVLIIH